MPERLIPGIPLKFATTLGLGGYGRGAIVTSHEGRPTKIEGNPSHPGGLSLTDVFAEAEIFHLFTQDGLRRPLKQGREIRSWAQFVAACGKRDRKFATPIRARGFRLLTGHLPRPTLLRQIKALQSIVSPHGLACLRAIEKKRIRRRQQSAFKRQSGCDCRGFRMPMSF